MSNTQIKKPAVLAGIILSFSLAAGSGAFYFSTLAHAADEAQGPVIEHKTAVDVVTLESERLRAWAEFSGHLTAVDKVYVRPRVGGAIQQVLFEEGTVVKAGDPLYVIDPRPYEAEVASAEAALASAESQTKLAKTELDRAGGLLNKKLISRSAYDAKRNDYSVALASIESAKAALKTASLNLEYAHISAPISGRISRAEITVGNVIEAGANAPVLTTIVSNDRVYAEFDVDEQTYIRTARRSSGDEPPMPVELRLSDGDAVVYTGNIHSFDNHLDVSSGTIRARAVFKNTDGALVPGMYASIRLGAPDEVETLLISERAVGTDQDKKFSYIVTGDGKIAYREIVLGGWAQGKRIVKSGLDAGDRVVVNNIQRIRPEMVVEARESTADANTTLESEKLAALPTKRN